MEVVTDAINVTLVGLHQLQGSFETNSLHTAMIVTARQDTSLQKHFLRKLFILNLVLWTIVQIG